MTEPSYYSLGSFEEKVLLAISQLSETEKPYGVEIRRAVAFATGRDVSVGAIYTTLDRLEKKGYISSHLGESTPERGGRAKRYFCIEGAGEKALKATDAARGRLITMEPGILPA
jgi:DNA-binding PadR family transcriptional regulator